MKQLSSFLLLAFSISLQAELPFTGEVSPTTLRPTIAIQGNEIDTGKPPTPLVTREELGIVSAKPIQARIIHRARDAQRGLFEVRGTVTPGGDYLVMFPDGGHYAQIGNRHGGAKVNDMLAYRSKDKGKTWEGPTVAFDIDYNQHGFIPFIPKGSDRIYAFGTQPIPYLYQPTEKGKGENAPIGYRYSDDDGYHWSEVRLIRPTNDPEFRGMSVMRMTETDAGTWLVGSHEADGTFKPIMTRQYVLRSEDRGKSWEVFPNPRHGGWFAEGTNRMDEGRPINLGNGEVFLLARTNAGHHFGAWSKDDGKTWSTPKATPLVHPSAPPMLFKLSDGKTLISFHHNRSSTQAAELGNSSQHLDRSEIWFATSTDGGRSWSEPRFVFANALEPYFDHTWRDNNISYLDMFVDGGVLHIFCPHRWERVLYLTIAEKDLSQFPTRDEFLD